MPGSLGTSDKKISLDFKQYNVKETFSFQVGLLDGDLKLRLLPTLLPLT